MFGGLIDFTRQEMLESKHVLMTALREGRKFIDLFLSAKSTRFISAMFYEKENQVRLFIHFLFSFLFLSLYYSMYSFWILWRFFFMCVKSFLFYFILFYFILFYFILFYFILFYVFNLNYYWLSDLTHTV